MSLKRALAEEAELEKEFLATGNDPVDETTKPTDEKVPDFNLEDLGATEPEKDPQVITISVADLERDYYPKKRYTNYKTSTDKTIFTLRKENSELREALAAKDKQIYELTKQNRDLASRGKDPLGEVITPEDIELIGPEAVDIVKRATQKATENAMNPLIEEIAAIKAKARADAKKEADARILAEYNKFAADLGKLVPDYETIDHDPGFAKWMAEEDESTGEPRVEGFKRAETYRDADRISEYFIDYKASIPRSKKEMLEDKITPEANGAGATPQSKKNKIWTMAEINKFYADEAKGVYRNKRKEADEIEARISRAVLRGDVVD